MTVVFDLVRHSHVHVYIHPLFFLGGGDVFVCGECHSAAARMKRRILGGPQCSLRLLCPSKCAVLGAAERREKRKMASCVGCVFLASIAPFTL